MDKRYAEPSPAQQVERRREVLSHIHDHPELPIHRVVSLLRGGLRFTLSEYSRLTGVSARVIQDIEQGRGNPTLGTVEKLLAPFGLKLAVVSSRIPSTPGSATRGPEERTGE